MKICSEFDQLYLSIMRVEVTRWADGRRRRAISYLDGYHE
jgi:hypothetical protein